MAAMTDIRSFARKIADAFRPERIILFGSYARGDASPDSDVDLLVVMGHRGDPLTSAAEIRRRIRRSFPLDLLVRSPADLRRRLRMKDPFIHGILQQGRVLYEANDQGMGREGRKRLSKRGARNARSKVAKP